MSLLTTLSDWFKPTPPPDPEVRAAIERIPERVDPMLKTLPGLERQMQQSVRCALDHCRQIVGQLPPPIVIERRHFASDPLVHALFATADDIDRMLGNSKAIRSYLAEPASLDTEHFYALLAVRRQAKKTLGVAMDGDIVRSDVPVEYLYFSDHTLVEPAATLEATCQQLRASAFNGLLRGFYLQLEGLRQERQQLREDRDVERDQIGILRGSADERRMEAHARRVAELDASLRKYADLLQPDSVVAALAEFLSAPHNALRLEPYEVTVDRSGIVRDDQPGAPGAETLVFHEVIGRDRRRYIALLVRIPRAEAAQAVETVQEMQNRYLIL